MYAMLSPMLCVCSVLLSTVWGTKGDCPQLPGSGPFTFTVGLPDDCQQAQCNFYAAAKINSDNPTYVDFWLEGTARGYVALGLSSSGEMVDSDALACAVDPQTGAVVILDTYNVDGDSDNNVRDTVQNLCPYSANFTNGRIKCSFSRLVDTGDSVQDKILNASYTLLYAIVDNPAVGTGGNLSLSYHASQMPQLSDQLLNVITSMTINIIAPTTSSLPTPHSPEQVQFRVTVPDGCQPADCIYYLTIRSHTDNPMVVDFWIEGRAQGYIAVGLSTTGDMTDSDVLACAVDKVTGGVAIVDAYNLPDIDNNVRDTIQDLQLYSANVTDGWIRCSFGRFIDTGDSGEDKVLNGSYYLLYAAVDNPAEDTGNNLTLSYHGSQTPVVSDDAVNIVSILALGAGALPTSVSTTEAAPVTSPSILTLSTLVSMNTADLTSRYARVTPTYHPVSSAQVTPSPRATIPASPLPVCPGILTEEPYSVVATIPTNCSQSSCDYYFAAKINKNNPLYLDLLLEGRAMGYVAIGLSTNGRMGPADVMACAVDSSSVGGAAVVDTYNVARLDNNVRDTVQNLCPHSAAAVNGQLMCSFSRLIDTGDTLQDHPLNNSYYLLFAAVDNKPVGSASSLGLSLHSTTPAHSLQKINIVSSLTVGTQRPSSDPPPTVVVQTKSCPPASSSELYSFVATIPTNCSQSSCDYYFAAKINKNNPLYLDLLLEGRAKGYVAIGFSADGKMASSDVLACAIDSLSPNGASVVDTYNTVGYNNVRDNVQDICLHSAMVTNGRLYCSFSRLINTGDTQQDKNLNASYYLLYTAVDNPPYGSGSTLSLSKHSQTPPKTSEPVNIIKATGSALVISSFPKEALTKIHAIFMLIAWPLLATTGIFFAAWMKPALPPPPLPATWFKIHRVLMLASLLIGAAGFIIIFIANIPTQGLIAFSTPSSYAHFVIGILVMALHIINPIISAFRCLPDHPRRWIFNLLHGSLIGSGVQMLALVNCGIGASFYEMNSSYILGIYLAFVVLTFLLLVFLFFLFTIVAVSVGGQEGIKLGPAMIKPILALCIGAANEKKPPTEPPQQMVTLKQDIDNKDTYLEDHNPTATSPATTATHMPKNVVARWISLASFLIIVIPSIIVLIVLVAIQ